MSSTKLRVALLYGGRSGEHEVSLLSAQSVIGAIDPDKYEVIPIGISPNGEWLKSEESLRLLGNAEAYQSLVSNLPSVSSMEKTNPLVIADQVDIIFPLLHGTNGEDGTIQGLLELVNIPYVGAGVLASAVGMDKIFMKRIFKEAGIPQGDFIGYLRRDIEERLTEVIEEIEERFGYPCFIKPANLGSSVGISKAKNREELIAALFLACKYDRKILVEQYMNAREIEVGVLGNDNPIASVPGEIVSSNEFYDYRAKYIDGKSQMIIPADVTEAQVEEFQSLAIKAFQAIDGSGISRVDFFLSHDDGQIYLNEINTMPGFTPYSMYPLLWKHSGIPYSELIDRLLQLALERYQEKNKTITQYTID